MQFSTIDAQTVWPVLSNHDPETNLSADTTLSSLPQRHHPTYRGPSIETGSGVEGPKLLVNQVEFPSVI